MAGHVIPASGMLVEVDILEFLCPGVGICHTSIGLELRMVKELDLKLTLGMTERRTTESPPDEELWGAVQILVRPKGALFRSQAVSCPIGHITR